MRLYTEKSVVAFGFSQRKFEKLLLAETAYP